MAATSCQHAGCAGLHGELNGMRTGHSIIIYLEQLTLMNNRNSSDGAFELCKALPVERDYFALRSLEVPFKGLP